MSDGRLNVIDIGISLLATLWKGYLVLVKSVIVYVWNRLEVIINSCTDKNIYVLNWMENVLFPCNRVLQFFANWGKTSIVVSLKLLYSGQ